MNNKIGKILRMNSQGLTASLIKILIIAAIYLVIFWKEH